jgi:hypothetical protein
MPRKSSAALAIATPEKATPLKRRSGLPSKVKLLWGELVASMPADHFRDRLPLLTA